MDISANEHLEFKNNSMMGKVLEFRVNTLSKSQMPIKHAIVYSGIYWNSAGSEKMTERRQLYTHESR